MEIILRPAKISLVFSCFWFQETLLESQRTYFKGSIFVDVRVCLKTDAREKICCEIAGRKLRNPPCGRLVVDSSEDETAGSIPVWGVELCPRFSLLFSAV
jgi:hypothetical protein